MLKIAVATRYRKILSGLLLSACLGLIAACQAWFADAQGIRTDIHVQQGYETLGEIFVDTQQAAAPELPRSLPEERSNYLPTRCGHYDSANLFSASRHDSVTLPGRGGHQVTQAIHADWQRRDYPLDTGRLDNPATPVIAGQAEGFRFSAEYIPSSNLLVLSGTTPCLPFPGQERLARLIEESRTVVDLPWKHPPDRPVDRTGKCLDAEEQVVGSYYAFFREIELGEGDGLALLSAMESGWREHGFAVEKRGMASQAPWILASVGDFRLVAAFGIIPKRLWLGGETPCSPTGQWDNQSLVEQMEKVQKSQKK